MNRRLYPVFIALAVFVVAVIVGRFLVLPALRGPTVVQRVGTPADRRLVTPNPVPNASTATARNGYGQNQSVYDECLKEALDRRVDPIEARHTCSVISDSI